MKTKNVFWIFMLTALVGWTPVQGQEGLDNEGPVIAYHISYGLQWPGGDLADKFGLNFNLSNAVEFMTPNNWIVGLKGAILFGTEVYADPISGLRSPAGYLFADNNNIADVSLRQRGMHLNANFGKLIPVSSSNKRMGIRATVGVGLLQHKIRVQEDPQGFVIQITGDYKKGYDQLTNGLAISQFIGFQYMAPNRRLNLFGGFEFVQAFTQNRRDWDYFSFSKDDTARTDLLMGFRVGLILPFYLETNPDEIRY